MSVKYINTDSTNKNEYFNEESPNRSLEVEIKDKLYNQNKQDEFANYEKVMK